MNIADYFLTLLLFSPLLGILALLFIPKQKSGFIKGVAIASTFMSLILAFSLFIAFDYDGQEQQFKEDVSWISFQFPFLDKPDLKINYELAVDGLSVSFILLTGIVVFLAAIASLYIKKRWKEYFVLFLLLQIGMFGVFMAQNLLLFFIFFELTVIPMFFLIGIWGYAERERASILFLIYNGIGSAAMLLAFVALFMRTGEMNISAIQFLITSPAIGDLFKTAVFLTLLFAFFVKLPVFPLHTWMLKVHVQAHPAIVMIHAGILLKLGSYGLIRLVMGIFPDQTIEYSQIIAILGVINILYGAVLAFVQKDLKMVLAYSSISHMGIVLLGLAALNYSGLQGAIFQSISHGLIAALLFFIVGALYERTQTTEIPDLGGLAKTMPFISGIFLIAAMANVALPGTSGFIGEFLAFKGLFEIYPWIAAVGVVGIILTAVYMLRATLNTTFGPAQDRWADVKDARGFEVIPMVILVGLILLLGVYPNFLVEALDISVETIINSLRAGIGG